MPQYHSDDCWCPTCRRFRARLEALEAELAAARSESRAFLRGWIERERGARLRDNPFPEANASAYDCWGKGWQWRDDSLQREALEAKLAGALAENEELFQSRDRYSVAWKRATEALAAARHTIAGLEEALGIDTSPPSEEELAYARQLEEAGR